MEAIIPLRLNGVTSRVSALNKHVSASLYRRLKLNPAQTATMLGTCNLCPVTELLSELKTLNNNSLKGSGRLIQSLNRAVAVGNQMHSGKK